jgi:signal transduction histidine kinase
VVPTSASKSRKLFRRIFVNSYTARLTVIFILIAFATSLIAFTLLAITWEQGFREDSSDQRGLTAQATAAILAQRYESIGGWTETTVEAMPHISGLAEDMGIEVTAADGSVLYSKRPAAAIWQSAEDIPSGRRSEAPIIVNGSRVGTVYAYAFADVMSARRDGDMGIDIYVALLTAGLVSVTLAGLFGVFFSRAFTKPFARVISVSNEVRSGNFSARTRMEGQGEIARLGRAIDEMIDAVEKNKRLEHQITTDVAHELRTPLMAMQATIEAMIDGVLPTDVVRLTTLNSEVIRLGRLVDVQLELSRLESGKTELRIGSLNLGRLVEDLVVSHEMFVEDAGLHISCKIESGVMVYGDADLLRQAISNLLSNAVRYTPSGGYINVRVCSQRNLAQVFVSDTGVGIAAEDIPHVFSRFWRAETSRDRESGGLGVGLALVKEIASRHRGLVNVESKQGMGTTFTLSLPLREHGALAEAATRPRLLV